MAFLCLFAVTFLLRASPAIADSFTLDAWNVAELAGNSISITTSADANGRTTISVSYEGPQPALGIDKIYYNTSNGPFTIVSTAGGFADSKKWNFNGTTAGGFGSFNSHKTSGPGGTSLAFSLTLNDGFAQPTAQFALNDHASYFTVHVRYGMDCSGWVASTGASSGTLGSNGACAPGSSISVPETSSLTLLLIGFGGLGCALLLSRFRIH